MSPYQPGLALRASLRMRPLPSSRVIWAVSTAACVSRPPGASVFPYVLTSYRLTEHHTAGGMTRSTPYLSELQPGMFVEVSYTWRYEVAALQKGNLSIGPARIKVNGQEFKSSVVTVSLACVRSDDAV